MDAEMEESETSDDDDDVVVEPADVVMGGAVGADKDGGNDDVRAGAVKANEDGGDDVRVGAVEANKDGADDVMEGAVEFSKNTDSGDDIDVLDESTWSPTRLRARRLRFIYGPSCGTRDDVMEESVEADKKPCGGGEDVMEAAVGANKKPFQERAVKADKKHGGGDVMVGAVEADKKLDGGDMERTVEAEKKTWWRGCHDRSCRG